jgi:rare lipoprotein A
VPNTPRFERLALLLIACAALTGVWGPAHAEQAGDAKDANRATPHAAKPHLDRSGRRRVGKASFYARRLAGSKMADGTRMQPNGDAAASKTLPLGTTAEVTNLDNGRTARVTIRDRGPFVKGRIVDLSPSTAREIGLDVKDGVARVAVTPIEVPSP